MNDDSQLPALVRRYVERNVPAREPPPQRIELRQVGEMQLRPGRWTSFEATQAMRTDRVEFSWRARFSLAPLVSIHVVDSYRAAVGQLAARLWGLIPVMRATGPELARGEAMRYLAELPWAPYALAANRELEWGEVDGETVEVATQVGSTRAVARLHFDARGDIAGASGDRPRLVGKRSVETPFRGSFGDYEMVDGLRVPTTAEAAWELPDGPFTYFRGRLTGLRVT